MTTMSDDSPLLLDEDTGTVHAEDAREWKVLIVDDDEDVHKVTVFALGRTPILGRKLRFLHAYTSLQAIDCLKAETDIAVILLDVVMEEENAGLTLVRKIRKELGLLDVRIILRTGQPGFAPEIEVIRDYDINDYKLKSELSRSGLYTAITTSIRSYEQIYAIGRNRRGLDSIVQSSRRMLALHGMHEFAQSILDEIGHLLQATPEGIVCARRIGPSGQIHILAGTGRFAQYVDRTLDLIDAPALASAIEQSFAKRRSQFSERTCILHFPGKTESEFAAHIETEATLDEINQQLLAVFCANVTVSLDNAQLFDQLHDHAYNDQLLHIPNRLDFMRTVSNAILTDRASKCIAVVDIDHFSQLNDALGHRYGDLMLKAVAARLTSRLPAGTVVARLAADTFGILGDADKLSPDLLAAQFHTPFIADGTEQSLTATFGLARLSEIEGTGSEAVKSANIALNLAKINARGEGIYFNRHMEFEARARLRLLRELRSAFDRERLFLVYQPQYHLQARKMTGIEALLRWRADDGNFIPPDKFIPLAESSGLIIALGAWVLRTACHDLKRLIDGGFEGLRIAINVSASQFRHPNFIGTIDQVLQESGIPPHQLELEITETVAMLDADLVLDTLRELKSRGIAIAIDDFGTGFSSLKYLERFKVDRLKIDKSFINQMTQSHGSLRIVETIVQLAHSLQLEVTAEGVELTPQAERLEAIGCHEAQGYLFAKPMDYRQLCNFLATPPLPPAIDAPPPGGIPS